MKKQFTQEQIIYALRQADSGMSIVEVCRKMGNARTTFLSLEEKVRRTWRSRIQKIEAIRGGKSETENHRRCFNFR